MTHWHTGKELTTHAADELAREVRELRQRVQELEAAAEKEPEKTPARKTRKSA